MRNQGIRSEMLKCADNCRVNVLPIGKLVSLAWIGQAGTHREVISKKSLALCSLSLLNALESATVAMKQ